MYLDITNYCSSIADMTSLIFPKFVEYTVVCIGHIVHC